MYYSSTLCSCFVYLCGIENRVLFRLLSEKIYSNAMILWGESRIKKKKNEEDVFC